MFVFDKAWRDPCQPVQKDFTWVAAVTTGVAHIEGGTPCQDAVAVEYFRDADGQSWIIAAISDGAGSCRYAEEASRIAVDHCVAAAVELIVDGHTIDLKSVMTSAVVFARTSLLLAAEAWNATWQDVLATLLVCITDGRRSVFAQIGDGAIITRGEAGKWDLIFQPQHGRFINESYFLSEPDALDRLQLVEIDGTVHNSALFSDGLEALVLTPSLDVHPPLFDCLTEAMTERQIVGECLKLSGDLTAVLASGQFQSLNPDDMSCVVIRCLDRRD